MVSGPDKISHVGEYDSVILKYIEPNLGLVVDDSFPYYIHWVLTHFLSDRHSSSEIDTFLLLIANLKQTILTKRNSSKSLIICLLSSSVSSGVLCK